MDAYHAFLTGKPAPPRETAARRLIAQWRAEWEAGHPKDTPEESEAILENLNQRLERMAQRLREARAEQPDEN